MYLVFTLSMPGRSSWNGRWSGEEKTFAIVKPFTTQKQIAKAQEILAKGYFSYGWSDGWRAGIAVSTCDAAGARKVRAKSSGFCGYDWMVESILARGCIKADHEIAEERELVKADHDAINAATNAHFQKN